MIYEILLLASDGTEIELAPSNEIIVLIGCDGREPMLRITSNEMTANRSAMTFGNPMNLRLDRKDLRLAAGIYDIELVIVNDSSASNVAHIRKGILKVRDTQFGATQ